MGIEGLKEIRIEGKRSSKRILTEKIGIKYKKTKPR